MRRILTQLTFSHMLVAVASVALFACLSSYLFTSLYVRQRKVELTRCAQETARLARSFVEAEDTASLALLAQSASASVGGRACILGPGEAELIAASFEAGRAPSAEAVREMASREVREQAVQTVCTDCQGMTYTCAAPIVTEEGSAIGSVLVRSPIAGFDRLIREHWANALIASLAASLLAVIPALLLSGAFSRPLERIARAAGSLATGDFTTRARAEGPLEIAELARSLNSSAGHLEAAFEQLRTERERLRDVLASMHEGVVACDETGAFLLANAAATRLLGIPEDAALSGRQASEVAPAEIAEALVSGRDEPIAVGSRKLLLRTTELARGEGFVAVISDVTERERLDRTRREFVATASHQLRTPLTSIRGYLEAVTDGTAEDESQRERCIASALSQVVGLESLVSRLLQLSKLQAGAVGAERALVALDEVACRAADYCSHRASERGVRVEVRSEGSGCAEADGELLVQAAANLVDNAVRHSPQGGVVTIAVSAGEGEVGLEVHDEGPGIPADQVERVWERFASGSSAGAAGLGLAIVREIVEAHGGRAYARGGAGGGAVFGFRLPSL